jgi:hypothetical protein
MIARWFAERRYAGSKDRRAIRELVYDAIRLCGERPESGRAAMLALAGRHAARGSPKRRSTDRAMAPRRSTRASRSPYGRPCFRAG